MPLLEKSMAERFAGVHKHVCSKTVTAAQVVTTRNPENTKGSPHGAWCGGNRGQGPTQNAEAASGKLTRIKAPDTANTRRARRNSEAQTVPFLKHSHVLICVHTNLKGSTALHGVALGVGVFPLCPADVYSPYDRQAPLLRFVNGIWWEGFPQMADICWDSQ